MGIGFAIFTFFTGFLCGELTWGNGFSWDLRLYTAATLIVLYFAFIAMHHAIDSDTQADKATAVLAITTVAIIPLIKYSVEIGGLTVVHQSSSSIFSGQKSAIDKSYLIPLLTAIAGFYLMGVALVLRRARIEVLRRNKSAKWVKAMFDQQLEER